MTVGYLVNQYPSLSHTFIRREIRALEALGVAVDRFSIRASASQLLDPADHDEAQRTTTILAAPATSLIAALLWAAIMAPMLTVRTFALSWRMTRGFERRALRTLACWIEAAWLARCLRARRLKHLHVHFGTNSASVGRLAAQLASVTYSMTVHGPEEFDNVAALDLAGKIRDASVVIAVSSYGRSQLCRLVPQRMWSKVHVVRCGLDLAEWPARRNDQQITGDLCFVGRLGPQKGLPVLLEAIKLLKDRDIDVRATIVGDGELRDTVAQYCNDAGIAESVELVGPKSSSEVHRIMAASRIVVVPSFAEGLPVVIMEALALGCPVISTYVAGIPELVDESCGRLVVAGDAPALADAIAAVLELCDEERSALGRAGRRRVAAAHDIATSARALQALLPASG